MRKLTYKLLSLALVFAASMQVYSQTIDEIIAKNIDAMGGKEKIQSITSLYIENTMEAMGNESTNSTLILNGKGAKTKSDFNGQAMIQCYTDKGGWAINPFAGGAEATVMPEQQYLSGKSQIFIGTTFWDYAAKGIKVELIGKEKLQNVDVFKVKLTIPENQVMYYYIDASTYYVVQSSMTTQMMDQQTEIITKYSDYQKTDFGYVLPKVTTTSFGEQFSMVYKLKKAEFNIPVDPLMFDLGNTK